MHDARVENGNFDRGGVSPRAWQHSILLGLPIEMLLVVLWRLCETVLRSRLANRIVLGDDPLLRYVVLTRSRIRIHIFSEALIVNLIDEQFLHLGAPRAKLAHSVITLADGGATVACLHLRGGVLEGTR